MLTDPPAPPSPSNTKSIWKNPLLYSSMLVGLVLLIVAWIFFSRWQQNRSLERRSREERSQKRREDDRAALEQLGGKELAIQSFYATPGAIRRGESLQLCYGVANAKTVKLEPQTNPVWPSYSRCVNVSPTKSTTYTLTVSDAFGNIQAQSLEVKVQ